MGAPKLDRTGIRYGRLVATRESPSESGYIMWLCECDCGNETIVRSSNLGNSSTKSCGCLQKEISSNQRGEKSPCYIHGDGCGWRVKEQKEFHESIRRRDNYICQDCGKTQEQELAETRRILSVHHKDDNHFNNVPENATTLCLKCHNTASAIILADRKYWAEMKIVQNTIDSERLDNEQR